DRAAMDCINACYRSAGATKLQTLMIQHRFESPKSKPRAKIRAGPSVMFKCLNTCRGGPPWPPLVGGPGQLPLQSPLRSPLRGGHRGPPLHLYFCRREIDRVGAYNVVVRSSAQSV